MSAPAQIIEAETLALAPTPVMVHVTAPSSLEGGYTFDAVYNGVVFPVTIPPGGVKSGQKFSVPFLPAVEAYAVAVVEPLAPPQNQQQRYASSETSPMLSTTPINDSYNNNNNNNNRGSDRNINHHHAPLGTWKTGLFDCFSEGCFHPSLCNAFFFPGILMGQVLTRMKLNGCGQRAERASGYKNTTLCWMLLTIAYLYAPFHFRECVTDPSTTVLGDTLENILDDDDVIELRNIRHRIKDSKDIASDNGCTSVHADLLRTISWVWFWATALVLAQLRQAVRRANGISSNSGSCCSCCCCCCQDLCCAVFCGFCTVAQLARQTVNYREKRAYCCTKTGLADREWFDRQEAQEQRHKHGHHLVHAHQCCDHDPQIV